MVNSAEHIKKELQALEEATAKMAGEFQELYKSYLEVFGQATKRQLILASYHLCTQTYPEAFLQISVSQRQKLQKTLRELGNEACDRLNHLMKEDTLQEGPKGWQLRFEPESRMLFEMLSAAGSSADFLEKIGAGEPEEDSPQPAAESSEPAPGTFDSDNATVVIGQDRAPHPEDAAHPEDAVEAEGDEGESSTAQRALLAGVIPAGMMPESALIKALTQAVLGAIDPLSGGASEESGQPLTPAGLTRYHLLLEQQIRMILQGTSRSANQVLQKAGILPDLPEVVLAAATDMEIPMEKTSSVPNLLNVLVEVGRDDLDQNDDEEDQDKVEEPDEIQDEMEDPDEDLEQGDEPAMMTHLVAINLRLADIEFTDAHSSLWRGKLRSSLGKLKQLSRRYKQKQRERAIAEAEQAWRSIWYDDTSA